MTIEALLKNFIGEVEIVKAVDDDTFDPVCSFVNNGLIIPYIKDMPVDEFIALKKGNTPFIRIFVNLGE